MGRVVHFEIHCGELDRAERFYTTLFGWQVTRWPGPVDYRLLTTGEDGAPGINGALVGRRGPAPVAMQAVNAFVCTVDVADLDAMVALAQDQGGSVALPRMPIPGVGYLAYVTDTEGNILGLLQADPAAT